MFVYLHGCAGPQLQHVGSSVFIAACGILFPKLGSDPGPLHWKCGVLATGPSTSPQNHGSDSAFLPLQKSLPELYISLRTRLTLNGGRSKPLSAETLPLPHFHSLVKKPSLLLTHCDSGICEHFFFLFPDFTCYLYCQHHLPAFQSPTDSS